MQILEDLYLGDVRPGERSGNRSHPYIGSLNEIVKAEEAPSASSNEEQKKLFGVFEGAGARSVF